MELPPSARLRAPPSPPRPERLRLNAPTIWPPDDEGANPPRIKKSRAARPRASVTAPGRLRLVAQTDRSDAGRDIQAGTAFNAERLQRDSAVGAAEQHIGSGPDPHCGAAGGADIIAVERTGPQIGGRRE